MERLRVRLSLHHIMQSLILVDPQVVELGVILQLYICS